MWMGSAMALSVPGVGALKRARSSSDTRLVATAEVANGLVSEDLRARLSAPTAVTLKAVPEPIHIHEIYPLSD